MAKSKQRATVTIHGAALMSTHNARRLEEWLIMTARDFRKSRKRYTKRFTGRFYT